MLSVGIVYVKCMFSVCCLLKFFFYLFVFFAFLVYLCSKNIYYMEKYNVTLLKTNKNKDVINRLELSEVAQAIQNGVAKQGR